MRNFVNQKFGRLIVIKLVSENQYRQTFWLCKCDCGKEVVVRSNSLQSGHTKSCGCLQREIASKQINKNNPNYKDGHVKAIFELKEKIRRRDNYTCQNCDITQEEHKKKYNRILDVHHIDGDNTNNIEENMITYCRGCHRKIEPNGIKTK